MCNDYALSKSCSINWQVKEGNDLFCAECGRKVNKKGEWIK